MMRKKRLGKGLESLIEPADVDQRDRGGGVGSIALSKIELSSFQPREHLDEAALEELVDSIRNAGILQPVVVRPGRDGMYELVMGERRLRAARRAGLHEVPAIVRQVDDDRMLELALMENVQRQDLDALEKARALKRMCDELNLTQEQAAERIGLRRPTVANLLRLLDLPEEVQHMVSRGTLSAGHARAVLSVSGDATRLALAKRIVAQGLSVREAERLAGENKGVERRRSRGSGGGTPPHVQRLQAVLSEAIGAGVRIRSRGGKGRIVIQFTDNEEFERLFSFLTGGDDLPV